MKNTIKFIILFCLLSSFANIYAQDDDPTRDKYITVDAEKDVADKLNQYLLAEDVLYLEEAKKEFANIKSSTDLANFYNVTIPRIKIIIYAGIQISNPNIMYAGDDAPVITWFFLHDYMPYISVELLCSECDSEPLTNILPFIEAAFLTPEKDDDIFFETLEIVFYNTWMNEEVIWDGGGNLGNWHTMDGCDFCSYSNLGSGQIYKILENIQKTQEAGNNFNERLETLKYRTLSPIRSSHYAGTKEEVIDEINKIMNNIKLTDVEIFDIKEARSKIKTDNTIQYNCEDGGCEYDW